MVTPDTIDFDKLLRPIAEDNPTGSDLRQDPASPYPDIKSLAGVNRDKEKNPHKYEGHNSPEPDWASVAKKSQEILSNHSKDLEIAAILAEALLRLHNFAGLRDGFRLLKELTVIFWDSLYPAIDGEISSRIAPLAGLNGILIIPISKIPLTIGINKFAYWQYDAFFKKPNERGLEEIKLSAIETARVKPDFYPLMRDDLDASLREFSDLCGIIKQKCVKDIPPPSSDIFNILEGFRQAIRIVSKEDELKNSINNESSSDLDGSSTMKVDTMVAASIPQPSTNNAAHAFATSNFHTREQAFATLKSIAEYFRTQEPHSPISYILYQAVRWGHLSLPELVQELIGDEKARNGYFKLTGIQPDWKSDKK